VALTSVHIPFLLIAPLLFIANADFILAQEKPEELTPVHVEGDSHLEFLKKQLTSTGQVQIITKMDILQGFRTLPGLLEKANRIRVTINNPLKKPATAPASRSNFSSLNRFSINLKITAKT